MDTSKYTNLPDSLTQDETHHLFEELLAMEQPQSPDDAVALAQAMDEVADRHWHTYTLLDDTTRENIDAWVIRNWDRSSLKKARALIAIVAKLGLANSADLIRRQLNLETSPSVKAEIECALREFGATVDDPYSGMRKHPQ